MKYKLINKVTNEEFICEKITVDGYDYYVNNDKIQRGDWYLDNSVFTDHRLYKMKNSKWGEEGQGECKKLIATNVVSTELPKIIEDDLIKNDISHDAMNYLDKNYNLSYERTTWQRLHEKTYIAGYNQSQQSHPFSEEDMLDFGEWCENIQKNNHNIRRTNPDISRKELLEIWKSERIKIIYYYGGA